MPSRSRIGNNRPEIAPHLSVRICRVAQFGKPDLFLNILCSSIRRKNCMAFCALKKRCGILPRCYTKIAA